jgi:hypothetical protein
MATIENLPGSGPGGWGPVGTGAVEIPLVAGRRIVIVGVSVMFDSPSGGSGTVAIKFGGVKRWEAQVNGGLSITFPEELRGPSTTGASIECAGAKIRVVGWTAPN